MPLRHDRRRRVLTDDVLSGASAGPLTTPAGESGKPSKEAYAAAARRQQQPHLTDLVPLGWLAQVLAMLAGVTVIVGMELTYTWLPELRARLAEPSLSPLDLASAASLAHWYSSMLLALSAAASILVYRVRSHRLDDYRGRYRMWRWVVLCGLLLSVNETARLDSLGEGLLKLSLQGTSVAAPWVWAVGCACLWGLLAVRLMFEVRQSLPASLVVLFSAVDLLVVATAHLWSPWDLSTPHAIMLTSGLRMLGHLTLLWGIALYARHVILEAEGRLMRRAKRKGQPAKRKRAETGEADSASGSKSTKPVIDQAHKGPGTPARSDLETAARPSPPRSAPARAEASAEHHSAGASNPPRDESDEDDDDDSSDWSSMSRAERKRLKRQQRAS